MRANNIYQIRRKLDKSNPFTVVSNFGLKLFFVQNFAYITRTDFHFMIHSFF